MALVPCAECGKEKSDSAESCPHCGFKLIAEKSGAGPVLLVLGLVFIASVLAIVGLLSRKDPTQVAIDNLRTASAALRHSNEAAANLAIVDFACSSDGPYSYASGHVENKGADSVQFVKVSASFYGKGKSLIETAFGYADTRPLLPGQRSTFKILGPVRQQVKTCAIDGASR